jgi:hypothetical protein
MENQTTKNMLTGSFAACALLMGWLMASVPATAQTLPAATPPYKISVFVNSPNGISQPDSIVQWHVPGHNDGLRVIGDDDLW